jgi:hypothetical protein
MKVEVWKPPQADVVRPDRGNFCLWYGKSGVGKSATTIATAEDPILWIIAERGQVDLTIAAVNRMGIKLKTAYYEGWDDLLAFVYDLSNFNKIKSVLFDGITHVMNIKLSDEILDENYAAMDHDKIEKDLTMRVKMSQEGYGTLSKQMNRLMNGFERLTIAGIDVHCTARDQDNPKWNRELSCGPALAGKEFGRDFKGYFDFIGLVESNVVDGEVVYPPLVSCDDNGGYLSKWTGIKPNGGVIRKPFNIKRILDTAHGRTAKKGGA